MNNNIYPCIWFNKNGSEAARFYCNTFPDTTIIGDNGLVQMLNINGQRLMFLSAGPEFTPNPSISFLIANEDENETIKLYNKLAENGVPLMPLDSYPFSKKYGWVRDQFGITWQLYTGAKGNTDQYFTPTLMFVGTQNGRAKEAIAFYTRLFPGSATEGILEYDGKEDVKGNVQHAQFHLSGYTMACMDSSIEHTFNFTEGISIVVIVDGQAQVDYYWDAMTVNGGQESMCGWLKDKFGVSWQIVPKQLLNVMASADREKAKAANNALMKMKKIIVADL